MKHRFASLFIALLLCATPPLAIGDTQNRAEPELSLPELRLPELLQDIGAIKQRRVCFQETKRVDVLATELLQSGTLSFRHPDYLRRQTRGAGGVDFIIRGDRLTATDPLRGEQQIALTDYPALLAFSESLRALLAGDLAALQRHYETQLEGSRAAWTLHLKPRQPALADYIDALTIEGINDDIHTLTSEEVLGDVTVTRIVACASHS